MTIIALFTLICWKLSGAAPYACGQKEIRKKSYGAVELRVECSYLIDSTDNNISVLEYKGDVQHGVSIHFDSLWRKRDSSFYLNGKKNGTLIFWDTLGNLIGRENFRNGKHVGKLEAYWRPGSPSIIKNYNAQGKEEGPWEEWWKNGNKKAEYIAKGGLIVSGAEYYPNGKPRVRYATKYEPKVKSVLKTKYIEAESWAPDGRPAGKITKGQGQWMIFPDGTEPKDTTVFLEVYKDTLMVEGHALTPAEAAKRLQ